MSRRYRSGYLTASPPALGNPSPGIWTADQQFSARGQGLWPTLPGQTTIGTATLTNGTTASVTFTAPTCAGYPATITGYTAISTPGCLTGTSATSPVAVTGLTAGTSYTFRVQAANGAGSGAYSASSNSVQPLAPGAPTIGTATAGNCKCAAVTFTAPACTGNPAGISTYTVTSTPGCITKTGAASPLTVTGLTEGTSYTFKVKATGTNGLTGNCSAASNSITAKQVVVGQQLYSSASGTFSWVAPTGVTKVSVLVVGGGSNSGGGGALRYMNNYTVTPGSSYTVVVGAGGGGPCAAGGQSYFVNTTLLRANGGNSCCNSPAAGVGGCGGGSGGPRRSGYSNAGGGAAGYSGNGGGGEQAGSGGGGGGGGASGGGGGGVGLFGQGANGAAGLCRAGGGGGSGGASGAAGNPANNYGGAGGLYGGGGGAGTAGNAGKASGARGAVRIVWPGCVRRFPSTCVGNF